MQVPDLHGPDQASTCRRFFYDEKLSEISEDAVFTIIAPLVASGVHWSQKNPDSGLLSNFLYNGFFQCLFITATAFDFTRFLSACVIFEFGLD